MARADRLCTRLNRPHRRLLVAPVNGNETAQAERTCQNRNPVDLVLVEDVHARMECVEKDRGIDVALVVRAVNGSPAERQVLSADNPETDAGQRQAQTHADVTENVQQALQRNGSPAAFRAGQDQT